MFSSPHRTLSKRILGRPQKQNKKERRYTLAKYTDYDSESVYEARTSVDLAHSAPSLGRLEFGDDPSLEGYNGSEPGDVRGTKQSNVHGTVRSHASSSFLTTKPELSKLELLHRYTYRSQLNPAPAPSFMDYPPAGDPEAFRSELSTSKSSKTLFTASNQNDIPPHPDPPIPLSCDWVSADTDADLQHPSLVIQQSVTPVPLTLSLRDAPLLREEVVDLFDKLERPDIRARALNTLYGCNMVTIEEDGEAEEEEGRRRDWEWCMNNYQERLMKFEKHKVREIKMRKESRTRRGNGPMDGGSVMDFSNEAGQSTRGFSSPMGITTSASSSRSSQFQAPKSSPKSAKFGTRFLSSRDDGYKNITRSIDSDVLQPNDGKGNSCMSKETIARMKSIAARKKIVDGDWEMAEHVGDSDDRYARAIRRKSSRMSIVKERMEWDDCGV